MKYDNINRPEIICSKTFRLKFFWIWKVAVHAMYDVERKLYSVITQN